MGNIISYVEEYGDRSMKEHPFNEVDALVLSQFIYLKWEHIIPGLSDGCDAISIKDMDKKMRKKHLFGEVFMDERYEKDNKALFNAMLASKRFGELSCNYRYDTIDKDAETQFFAMTVFIPGALPIVVFRGTDETLLGWKEDFNMAYRAPVPGQLHSSTYIKQVGLRISGEFITAGHSKGGNLAVYSILTAPEEIKNRTVMMYNFDGPGFNREIMEQHDYPSIASRIFKVVPESSIVGVILERDDNYKTVTSDARGGAQHNPYTWLVYEGRFDYIENVSTASRVFRDSITGWMDQTDPDKREVVFATAYEILAASDASTTIELTKKTGRSSRNMLRAMLNVPDETWNKFKESMKEFKIQI
ncbi:MAG: DUF2974 domain-containing protein [Lachnospiraceae bacterium]|nr:DUF2974 domain-containing protein [Lachnospiraceae bacterium]